MLLDLEAFVNQTKNLTIGIFLNYVDAIILFSDDIVIHPQINGGFLFYIKKVSAYQLSYRGY